MKNNQPTLSKSNASDMPEGFNGNQQILSSDESSAEVESPPKNKDGFWSGIGSFARTFFNPVMYDDGGSEEGYETGTQPGECDEGCNPAHGESISGDPGGDPTGDPGGDPTGDPGGDPTGDPGGDPTGDPGGDPTGDPGGDPSCNTGGDPSCNTGGDPSGDPGGDPSGDPGGDPSGDPGGDPSGDPGGDPSGDDPSGDPGGDEWGDEWGIGPGGTDGSIGFDMDGDTPDGGGDGGSMDGGSSDGGGEQIPDSDQNGSQDPAAAAPGLWLKVYGLDGNLLSQTPSNAFYGAHTYIYVYDPAGTAQQPLPPYFTNAYFKPTTWPSILPLAYNNNPDCWEVPMPKKLISKLDLSNVANACSAPSYQQHDYLIAGHTGVFNYLKICSPASVDIRNESSTPHDGLRLTTACVHGIPDFDPTFVKAICMQESDCGNATATQLGRPRRDIMQVNNGLSEGTKKWADWQDLLVHYGLTQYVIPDPQRSMWAGIRKLCTKGFKHGGNGTNPNPTWMTFYGIDGPADVAHAGAAHSYNGGGAWNYVASVKQMVLNAVATTNSDY